MTSLSLRQRVRVTVCEGDDGEPVFLGGAPGTVARIRRDGGAWVCLDERSDAPGAHSFDDEARARWVLAWPNGCAPHHDAAPRFGWPARCVPARYRNRP
jgi:hypothetical protein